MGRRMEEAVTWKTLIPVLGMVLTVTSLLVGGAVSRAESVAEKASMAARAAVSALEAKVDVNKRDADAGNYEVRKDIQAVYNFLLTRKPQERFEGKQ